MRFEEVRGTRVRFHATGDPAAPPVVLLHGIGRSLEDWALQHPLLDNEYRVISIDMPGFGLSQRMPAPTTLDVLADGVWATLDTIGENRPVHLMGNSLGGAVSMRMLADTPDRVSTLTLVNSAGFGKEVTVALRMLAVPGLGRQMLRRIDRITAPRMERMIFADRALVTPERVAMAIKIARQPDFAPVYLEIAKALGGLRGVAAAWRTDLLARVAASTKPTMLVWGDRDLILPSKHLAAARAAFPHAQSHMFARTGHMPQIERPDEFAGLVRPMLARVAA
ncbi:4,5-9,10-diseco-3-hydroxy-5,9,17-trioxoandrosta-1 (10),2-diene-4-oate hydrolase [Actinoplanes philippinensis]|uniref:Pimeloyl-ACP methyl ester carboxylesterase n=1 Tax=Actinoplanes philippinensis TaxID=35752 RepID=A0A1I2GZX2_9ACTN|nr:alpha/beta fold hydrolase [Actinoplanes philippinensis]GIE78239.1 4,5-9,10-diseco-3-hydroxy-5,9,17-trioxoandrosta-1 (10),2-diene-4-oate hydrolase [Actinoplanes philippinensis]SFF22703.1 Pimeloyl-ACP methyl ester carboxylesterase [Actinoplanes philippinensis]